MTPEQQVDAVKAALAEAGWPDVEVWWNPRDEAPEVVQVRRGPDFDAAIWRSFSLVQGDDPRGFPCWPCWSECGYAEDDDDLIVCDHDWRSEPWPEVPERVS